MICEMADRMVEDGYLEAGYEYLVIDDCWSLRERDKDGNLVVPKSDSILPSITRRSIVYIAEHYLNLKVDERPVRYDEIKNFKECALCGTAAVISPVGRIVNHDEVIEFPSGMEKAGEVVSKLYDTITGIQSGKIEAPEGWIRKML